MSLPSDSEASFDEGKEPQQLQVHQQHQGGPASVEEIQAFETSAYEALERDFQRVVAELLEDDTLEDFKEQYVIKSMAICFLENLYLSLLQCDGQVRETAQYAKTVPRIGEVTH